MITQVAIRQAEHKAVFQAFQLRAGVGLLDALPARGIANDWVPRGYGYSVWRERGTERAGPVYVELIFGEPASSAVAREEEEIRSSRSRKRSARYIGGQAATARSL